MSFDFQRTFNLKSGEKELGELLLSMPYPPCQKVVQKFKMIIIPKNVIQTVDKMPIEGVGMNMALIDSTAEHQEKKFLGINIDHVKRVWTAIKRIIISAGDAHRKPYHLEEQLFKPFSKFQDPQVERFLEEFIVDKQIALHLVKEYEPCVEGKLIAKLLSKTKLDKIFYRSVCQTAVAMLAYLPANPVKEDNQSDMFENLIPRSIEHFTCSVLMDMSKDTFNVLANVKPNVVNQVDLEQLAEDLNNQLIKTLIPYDTDLDEQLILRMASVNMTKSKDEATIDLLKDSVMAILDQAVENYKHSRRRLKKLKKDFIDFDKQKTAKLAIDQLSDMISRTS